ncbi:hypothetical protein PYW07_012579 [Mythimna separata]|uniref:Uncharacterized protein n=1 Tax=Mythimna separata TaxID=271217 RepID=A0AAD7Y8K4_MYTSE|nr:hypothetical protein PYW07_012579 [Mythimna separata]
MQLLMDTAQDVSTIKRDGNPPDRSVCDFGVRNEDWHYMQLLMDTAQDVSTIKRDGNPPDRSVCDFGVRNEDWHYMQLLMDTAQDVSTIKRDGNPADRSVCDFGVRNEDWHYMQLLMDTAQDVVRSTYGLIERVEFIKQKHLNSPAFEIGYVMFTLFEKYRKMIDKYNSSMTMGRGHFMMELLMYLEEIETHHWEIEHLANMLHEIERKYNVTGGLRTKYHEMTSKEKNALIEQIKARHRDRKLSSSKIYKIKQKVLDRLTPTPSTKKPPLNLSQLLNGSIYNELSWPVKVLLIKDRLNNTKNQISRSNVARANQEFAVSKEAETKTEIETKVETTTVAYVSVDPIPQRRIPSIEALVAERRQETPKDANNDDDNSMRLKLFRLMYETIRDSDLKCKRAELIRANYENSSTFEVGYLMGDVMDKYNIMSDISMTLNRLFHEWKPIEHINAYEQISNQAIEINHLIEMMKGISKKKEESKKTRL